MKKYRYEVKGMSCAACVAHVEKAAHKAIDDTCQNISVSLLTNSITFESGDEENSVKIEKDLAAALHAGGYELVTGEEKTEKKKENITLTEKQKNMRRLISSSVLTLGSSKTRILRTAESTFGAGMNAEASTVVTISGSV